VVEAGKVVVLNGTSSAGKTSLALAFQDLRARRGDCWVVFGIDDFIPRLPRQWADSRPIENGKTSLMLLIDQLDLLGATMDKIFDAVVRVDADALIAHGRFLQEKFGHASSGGTLNLGDQPPPPPPNSLDLP